MTITCDHWLHPTQVFDGHRLLSDTAIGINGNEIAAIVPASDLPESASVQRINKIVSPGFFDIQINGGGDVLFNTSPNREGLSRIAAAHAATGTLHWLPTAITDSPDVLSAACDAVQQSIGQFGIAGIHIEGPHIAVERKGAHKNHWIRPFDEHTLSCVTRLRENDIPVLITIAPEAMAPGQVANLVKMGAVVSIGHTNATSAQTKQTLDEGAQLFTHLFNAMSQIENREPNVVGTAINSSQYCSIIVDGLHVDLDIVGLATRARPVDDRMIIVTDAMPTVGGSEEFVLYGNKIHLEDGRLINDEGSLAGAHTTVPEEIRNYVQKVGIPLEDVLKMATSNPATLMKLNNTIGGLKAGIPDTVLLIEPSLSNFEVVNLASVFSNKGCVSNF
ncbi:MAG: N-acetylglucosamine-6-phosphate deacetylase [Paracoccaceae bacterium]